jgi:cbb3-type cytochrome oxidase maturation protein
MEIIYLLIPVSLVLLGLIVWILLWAVRDGQYDDLEGPAHRILMDEDRIVGRDRKVDPKANKMADKMADSKAADPALPENERQAAQRTKK